MVGFTCTTRITVVTRISFGGGAERYKLRSLRQRKWLSSLTSVEKNDRNPEESFSVARVQKNGSLSFESIEVSKLLRETSMHARDLFALDLTRTAEECRRQKAAMNSERKSPCAILPRNREIIISFGSIRAVIGTTDAILFNAHKSAIKLFSDKLACVHEELNDEKLNDDSSPLTAIEGYKNAPFELVTLEEILREVCNMYQRRTLLLEPIVDSMLTRVESEVFSQTSIHMLVPIKDALQEFEMTAKQSLECLTHLLENDEDMLGLLLQQQAAAAKKGVILDPELHVDVELLLEEYARQLNHTLQELRFLLRRVQSKQDMATLTLSVYRNRMIRANMYLSVAAVALASGSVVTGAFGMNLIHGLEESMHAFPIVVTGTSLFIVFSSVAATKYLGGKTMRSRAIAKIEEVTTLNAVLNDMKAIDFVIKEMVDHGEPLSKDEFRTKLIQYKIPSSKEELSRQQVDFIFGILDTTKDGFVYKEDFESLADFKSSPSRLGRGRSLKSRNKDKIEK